MSKHNKKNSEILKTVSDINENTKKMFMFLAVMMTCMHGHLLQYVMDLCRMYYTYPSTVIMLTFIYCLYININRIPSVYDGIHWMKNFRWSKHPNKCECDWK